MRCLLLATIAFGIGPVSAGADDPVFPDGKKNHWAWKRPQRSPLPVVRAKDWVRNPMDAFILARLEAAGLQPAPPASRIHLLRRVTFDLIGLPPTPAQVDAFLADISPRAWEKVIDRLLASPHYGERWGRHWLDLVRYADSNGYEFDEDRPDIWRYRDYVIRTFNSDKPFDRFIKEQLAGDELYADDPEALIATGFNLLGPDMTDSSNQAQRRQNTLDDMTETTGLAFLGMTVGCARCHDHKFEPIPQSDFFRLQAFFVPASFRKDLPLGSSAAKARHDLQWKAYLALTKETKNAIAELEDRGRKKVRESKLTRLSDAARLAHLTPAEKRTPAQRALVEQTLRLLNVSVPEMVQALTMEGKACYQELQGELKKYDGRKPQPLPVAMGLQDGTTIPRTFLLKRGELNDRGDEVLPGFPVILTADHRTAPANIKKQTVSSGRRTVLANWITSAHNPLTARVLVNRLWQHHFGRGIVATANDFGLRGERPSHPELLDWLATEFVNSGWSIKHMHRLMLMSATYQQAVAANPQTAAKDPTNALFGRMNRLRLEGEIIRDALLAVSGRLHDKMGGPGVFPPIPDTATEGAKGWKTSAEPSDHVRRSVYIFARRNLRFPFLEAFDLPDSNLSCPKRERSTTAPQALALLNAADVVAAAKALALRVTQEKQNHDDRIVLAYRLVLGRQPSGKEMQLAREFLQRSPLAELCRALFNVNEFVYLD